MTTNKRLVLTNCTVIDGTGAAPASDAAIGVLDGMITAIGAHDDVIAQLSDGGDPTIIDLDGRFVTAGLWNMHTHLSLSLPGELGHEINRMSAHDLALYMADGARRTLHAGVTSVRCVAERDGADFALRNAIGAGRVVGPRIFTAGKAIVCTGGHGHGNGDTIECDGPAEFRKATRRQVSLGADLIKVMISGGIAGQHEGIATPQLMVDELDAVLTTAHDWGRKVTAHAGPASVILPAVEAGLDCVEHGYQLDEPTVALMAERGVHLVPTLGVTRCDDFMLQMSVPCWMRQRAAGAATAHVHGYKLAIEAGVPIMVGSDIPPFWQVDGTSATVREIEFMVEDGLTPAQALQSATSIPADWMGQGDRLGTVEVGKLADLVAMTADPLADATNWRTIDVVVKDGVVERDSR